MDWKQLRSIRRAIAQALEALGAAATVLEEADHMLLKAGVSFEGHEQPKRRRAYRITDAERKRRIEHMKRIRARRDYSKKKGKYWKPVEGDNLIRILPPSKGKQ